MLSLYQSLATDVNYKRATTFNVEIKRIERAYNIKPIATMTAEESDALEYQFVNNYVNVLGKIYECYDRLLGISVREITVADVTYILSSMNDDPHARSILLQLIGMTSFYDIVPTTIIDKPNVKHFLSRYEYVKGAVPVVGCCVLI